MDMLLFMFLIIIDYRDIFVEMFGRKLVLSIYGI